MGGCTGSCMGGFMGGFMGGCIKESDILLTCYWLRSKGCGKDKQ